MTRYSDDHCNCDYYLFHVSLVTIATSLAAFVTVVFQPSMDTDDYDDCVICLTTKYTDDHYELTLPCTLTTTEQLYALCYND